MCDNVVGERMAHVCVCVSVCVTSQKFENMFVVCQIFMNAHFIAGEWGVAQMSPSNDHASVAQ